jgi:hypothetical protein
MCDDHAGTAGTPAGLTRRHVIGGAATLAAMAALGQRASRLPLYSAARPAAANGTSAYSMAMHIHSSFSEQSASMGAQLYQATANSVDVLWWTDHDHRMDGLDYRDTVHFTSLTHEQGGPHQGGAWAWVKRESGSLTGSSGGGIVTSPSSPNDPVSGGSMHLAAATTNGKAAKFGYYANSEPTGWNYRDNLTGQTLSIDVLLDSGWSQGYLELLIGTSYHEASGGRPKGLYSLSYQFVPSGSAHKTARGNNGIIEIPVKGSGWTTITFTPSDDIAALWPDVDHRDFALWELTLNAVSTGDAVSGYFDYLRFDRTVSGNSFFSQQAEMIAEMAGSHPSVTQHQGLEVSWRLPHLNWFGGNVSVPSYQGVTSHGYTTYVKGTVIPQAHASGALVCYNHPYGYSDTVLPQSQQDAQLRKVAALLLSGNVLGCDLIEVGYERRGGADLAHHVGLWDVMSRNSVFLTGNGTSDDHFGTNWHGIANNWITSAWAASTGQQDLLTAMAAGQLWCGSLSKFGDQGASMNLTVDGTCPMGSVSLSSAASRKLTVSASGIPSGGSVAVLQGHVDYAGSGDPTPNTKVIATYSPANLVNGGGQVTLKVDTSKECFARTAVLDHAGNTIALSNPVWMLHKNPPGGIPGPRQC